MRSHTAWMTRKAGLPGGRAGRSGSVSWAFVSAERTMHLLFPEHPLRDDVADAIATADALGATSTALWCAEDRAAPELDGLGFERGWQPWWMEASLPARSGSGVPEHVRARLVDRPRSHEAHLGPLLRHADVFLAEGYDDGRYAGRAWMLLTGTTAGLYDMEVWPAFRRRGIGRDILSVLMGAAAEAGADRMTLNATPEGAPLYATSGFDLLGAGRTYWRHRPSA